MIFLKFLVTGLFTALLFPPYFFLPIGFIIFPYLTFLILKLDSKSYFLNYFLCGFLYFFGFLSIFLIWIINPFFVFQKKIFDYLNSSNDCDFEIGPLEQLTQDGQLMVYHHKGDWACMDTYRDSVFLNDLWKNGNAFWKTE